MTRTWIGVDLSKDCLDICDPRRGEARIANEPAAIVRWLAGLGVDDAVVYEATSGCDRPLRLALDRAGRAGVRLNPLHAWHFARSLNLPKTDRVAQTCAPSARRGDARPARRRTRVSTRAARNCARWSSAATSSSAWRRKRRTASPPARCPSSPATSVPS